MNNIFIVILLLFSFASYAEEINLSACRDAGVDIKKEKKIISLYNQISELRSCEHDWLAFIRSDEAEDLIFEAN